MSDIWKYFEKLLDEKAKCKLCKKEISRKQDSTKGMWTHFVRIYSDIFNKLKGSEFSGKNPTVSNLFIHIIKLKNS